MISMRTVLPVTATLGLCLAAGAQAATTRPAVTHDPETSTHEPADPAKNRLVVTREDGTRFVLNDLRAKCGPSDSVPSRRGIELAGPRRAFDRENERILAPFLSLEAILRDVRNGATFTLPTNGVYNDAEGASLFIGDTKGSEPAPDAGNELSSDQQESSGTFFVRGRCTPTPRVTLKINAVLGSEFGDSPTVKVRGTVHSINH